MRVDRYLPVGDGFVLEKFVARGVFRLAVNNVDIPA